MKKRKYSKPLLKPVKVDNDISLCLQSPPAGPNEIPAFSSPGIPAGLGF